MKGLNLAEDIGWTLILFLVFMALAVIGLLLFIQLTFSNFLGGADPVSYSVEFVQIYTKPFALAEVLSHAKIGDRQLLEQAIEVSATNSLEGGSVTSLPANIEGFVDAYDFKYYYVSVNRDNKEIFNAQSNNLKCGANQEGFCVNKKLLGYTCDVGRVEIDDDEACKLFQTCCKWDSRAYATLNRYTVVSCGGVGVCSEGRTLYFTNALPVTVCDRGEIQIDNQPVCNEANNGDTPLCCAPATEDITTSIGATTRAVIPLLYKNLVYGTLEVTAR